MKNSVETMKSDERDPGIDAQAGELLRRIDAKGLEIEPERRVERDVEREERRRPEPEAAIEDEQERGRTEVPERLVEKRGMERLVEEVVVGAMRRVDLEPPREVGRLAEELLVPPVADAADCLRDEQARSGGVEQRA